jgi:hypothetical protein
MSTDAKKSGTDTGLAIGCRVLASKVDGTTSPIGYEEKNVVIIKYFLSFSRTKIINLYLGLNSLVPGEYIVCDLVYLNAQMRVPELLFFVSSSSNLVLMNSNFFVPELQRLSRRTLNSYS